MAVNPMQRKARNMFLLGMFLMLVIGGIAVGILIYQMSELNTQIKSLTAKSVYVLNKDIESGQTITMDDLKIVKQSYPVVNPIDTNIFSDDSSYSIKSYCALTQGVALTNDMIYVEGGNLTEDNETGGLKVEPKVKDDTRIQEYNMLKLPSQLEKGKYIDIRLTLPTGQDFVIVSHKEVVQCDTTTVWLKMSEDEIVMMNNAIIEYFVMTGSELYAIVYDKAGLQKAATPTYAMSSLVAYAYRTNPNILDEVKAEYEKKIKDGTDTKQVNDQIRTLINRQLDLYDDNRLGNIENKVQQSREKQQEKRNAYISDLDALQF